MAGKQGMKRYSLTLRMEIVRRHLEEGASLRSLVREYGLSGHARIQTWLKQYRETGEVESRRKKRGRPSLKTETDQQKIARLEMEITLLKKFREELRR